MVTADHFWSDQSNASIECLFLLALPTSESVWGGGGEGATGGERGSRRAGQDRDRVYQACTVYHARKRVRGVCCAVGFCVRYASRKDAQCDTTKRRIRRVRRRRRERGEGGGGRGVKGYRDKSVNFAETLQEAMRTRKLQRQDNPRRDADGADGRRKKEEEGKHLLPFRK